MKGINLVALIFAAVTFSGAAPLSKRHGGDNIYNDAHVLGDNDIGNTNINSDTVYVSNNNINTRADGKGNNSAWKRAPWGGDNFYDDVHVAGSGYIANTKINSDTIYVVNGNVDTSAKGCNNNSAHGKRHNCRRDDIISDAGILDTNALFHTNINSDTVVVDQDNTNTSANGNDNNSASA
ncbi:uncharacterized protein VTP21DRAFT_5177 [Calcarisporiella thermophila]|uniref:uncharacterized protein n=1 Tax=Calcarisporiella thermophila TaxID=911321 RepID=UPI003742C24D